MFNNTLIECNLELLELAALRRVLEADTFADFGSLADGMWARNAATLSQVEG